jgi:LuxR family maltose regulon positive regulatory protein
MAMLPLLATKLHTPRPRPGLVPRPQLIAQLNNGLQDSDGSFLRKLTLISAPAGFGKTTLLGEWIAGRGTTAAWVSLDERDNDPGRFWSYVIIALHRLNDEIGSVATAALQSGEPLQLDLLLAGLINEINRITTTNGTTMPILVLDDYQTITSNDVHESVMMLLDNQPVTMHLVVSSRADPPWPLARQRARRELAELRARDLRFTPDEVVAFLNDGMDLGLSHDDIATLDARTEGWAAGLQMAGLAIRGNVTSPEIGTRKRVERSDVSSFIKAFSGSNRFVLDYLVEEVLAQQPGHIQEFLLRSSVLDRLSASLCDAVVGRDDSHTILIQLDKANLFLVRLDDERHWYRYHYLFADLLRGQLRETEAPFVSELHRRASDWYEANGLIAEAVSHALEADDLERVTHLAEEDVLGMMERGELGALTGWLRALPDDIIHSRPWLCTASAWASAQTGQFDAALDCLELLEQIVAQGVAEQETSRIRGHMSTIRLYITVLTSIDWDKASGFANKALSTLPTNDLRTRGLVIVLLGIVQRFNHLYDAARDSLTKAYEASQAVGEQYVSVDLRCQLARVEEQQGRLREAAEISREAIALAYSEQTEGNRALPVVSYAHATLGAILLEWNLLDEALHEAELAARLGQQWGHFNSWIGSQQLLAQIYHTQGRPAEALDTLRKANQSYHAASGYTGMYEAFVRLMTGELQFASDWAHANDVSFSDELDHYHVARNLLISQA